MKIVSVILFFLSLIAQLNAQIISTVAGNGIPSYNGDGIQAIAARLSGPTIVAVDNFGNIFLSDYGNNRIRKVNLNGIITTVAGNGIAGYSGDSGLATEAQLKTPGSVAIDVFGNIYIVDEGNHCIRKISTSGIITTVAGTGVRGFSGDGGLATLAQLDDPEDVFVDSSSNFYIADYNNSRVRKVSSTGIISTIAGTGVYGYGGDGGPASIAQLRYPSAITMDALKNIYISDNLSHCIRKIDRNGIITTFAGTGIAGYSGNDGLAITAQLNQPMGLAIDKAGNLYIADQSNNRIRKVDTAGIITKIAGSGTAGFSGDGGDPLNAMLNQPMGVAIDSAGNIYIADRFNYRARKITYFKIPAIHFFYPLGAFRNDTIIIKGFAFTSASSVSFGGVPALSFSVIDDSTIHAIVGDGASGDVNVVTIGGTANKAGFVYVQPCSWLGTSNNNWNEPANWSCGNIPNLSNRVIINSGTVILNSNATVWSLSVSMAASLTINSPYQLVILH